MNLRIFAGYAILLVATWTYAGEQVVTPAPVRFVLTFDDGPDGRDKDNPTARILDTLVENPTQKSIKAIFFVQTRNSEGGATARGHALLEREHAQGHVLALHDGSTLGHPNHCKLSDAVLEQSLNDGLADLVPIAGRPTTLLRPPYLGLQRTYPGRLCAS